MQRVGFLMDDERRADVSKQLRYRAGGLVGEMRKLVGKSDFHPARLADVRRALFTRFRAPLFAVTPTGMPSTSSATLEALRAGDTRAAILSDLILRYRSATKTRATFLSVELGNDGRVHPSWRAFGTVSGRVACRAPNLMNLPRSTPDKDGNIDLVNRVRECYVAAPGYELVYFDLCFATGTGVDTPTGAVPIEKLKLGDLVYTYNKKTDRPAIGKVTQHINVGRKSVVKVTLDNGEVVRCTPDHKWLVRPWGKKPVMREAQLLQPGDRLVPLRKQIIQGREHIYATSAFKYSKTHIEVARAVHGPRPKNHDVHHKDENALNNAPGNLEYKHTRTHASEHGKVVARKCWGTPSIRRKLVRGLRAAVAANPNWQKGKNNSRFGDRRRRVVAVCLNCEKKIEEFASRPPRKFCSKKCYGIARRTGLNHKVVSVELDGAATVWSIAVSPDHNYALAAGVFVANCQAEMRFAANLSGDAAFIETCRGDVHAGNAKVIFPEAAKLGWLEKDLIKTKGKKYRDIAKNAGFAVCYGASAETVFAYLRAKGFNVSLSDVTAMLDQMRSTYRRYYDFVDENFAFVKRHGFMRTAILGRIRWFGWHETLPKTMNYPIQSGIADLMNERLINMIPQLPKGARLIAQIHDACIFECKKSVVAGMQELIQTTWDAPVIIPVSAVCRDGAQLQMPIDIKTGERWSDL
jgi:intein/homing endonuclease